MNSGLCFIIIVYHIILSDLMTLLIQVVEKDFAYI